MVLAPDSSSCGLPAVGNTGRQGSRREEAGCAGGKGADPQSHAGRKAVLYATDQMKFPQLLGVAPVRCVILVVSDVYAPSMRACGFAKLQHCRSPVTFHIYYISWFVVVVGALLCALRHAAPCCPLQAWRGLSGNAN